VISFFFAYLTTRFESGHNPALQDQGGFFWWWLVNMTGVGFDGDVLPQTLGGRVFGAGVIFSGLILLAIVISEVAAIIRLIYESKQMGLIRIKSSGHIVIYGYTSLTAGLIKLLRRHYGKHVKIVLISNDIERNPFPEYVDFIFANPISKSTFAQANVKEAAAAIILANDRFNDPDAYSLVIISGIANDNSKVITLVEVQSPDMKELFKQNAVDGFINRRDLLKDLIEKKDEPKLIRIINKESDLDEKAALDEDDRENLELV
jgi:voltage-gated potassium channel